MTQTVAHSPVTAGLHICVLYLGSVFLNLGCTLEFSAELQKILVLRLSPYPIKAQSLEVEPTH